MDDLNKDEETGAAHAGDMELGAGLYYAYVVADIPLLVSNFTGCESADWREQDCADVIQALRALLKAIATVSPGAKLGCHRALRPGRTGAIRGRYRPASHPGKRLPQGPEGPVRVKRPCSRRLTPLGLHLKAIDTMYGQPGWHQGSGHDT